MKSVTIALTDKYAALAAADGLTEQLNVIYFDGREYFYGTEDFVGEYYGEYYVRIELTEDNANYVLSGVSIADHVYVDIGVLSVNLPQVGEGGVTVETDSGIPEGVALALDPSEYAGTKYRGVDMSRYKTYARTPMMIKLTSQRRSGYAEHLARALFSAPDIRRR